MRRMKYIRAKKLKIVKEHVIGGTSLNDLSKKIVRHQLLCTKFNYICYTMKAFLKDSLDRTYTREEKLKVIERVYAGEAAHAIALEMGI